MAYAGPRVKAASVTQLNSVKRKHGDGGARAAALSHGDLSCSCEASSDLLFASCHLAELHCTGASASHRHSTELRSARSELR